MDDLNQLRSQLSRQQRDILYTIWRLFLKESKWAPARYIHEVGGGKATVRPILEELGGSIVYEFDENETIYYQLTLLGVLLSSEGNVVEEQLAGYLKIAKTLALRDLRRTHVSSKEIRTKLDLENDEVYELGCILSLSPFVSSGSFGQNEWNAGLPKDIEDVPDDLLSYIHHIALNSYDPQVPISYNDRVAYLSSVSSTPQIDIFKFVGDEKLHAIAAQDWGEAQSCFGAKAWKACVIACGAVLEGVLLDALLLEPEIARDARKARRPERRITDDLLQWDLVDLVDAAAEMRIISEASSHLGHAIRLHRNLVHPARQIKDLIEVTEGEAQISLNTVEKCIRDLSANRSEKRR